MKLHGQVRCSDCNQAMVTSFTVCEDGVVRCCDCGAKQSGGFKVSVRHSEAVLRKWSWR